MRNLSIVVGMVSRDSYSRLGPSFIRVLKAIEKEIPYDKFILADDGTDDTTKIVQRTLSRVDVIGGGGNRAVARQRIVERLNRDWLMFVDDDCLLQQGWLQQAADHLEDGRLGLIWGPDQRRAVTEFRRRGGTHDTMIRREALEGLKIPPFLHWYEDAWIKRHVESMGYTCKVNGVGCLHLKPKELMLRDNVRVSTANLYTCSRFMGLYGPDLRNALATLAGTMGDILRGNSSGERSRILLSRIAWFRYYANLYRYRVPTGVE